MTCISLIFYSSLLAQITKTGILYRNLPSLALGDTITWNILICVLLRHGFPSLAVQVFSFMHRISLPLDSYSLCTAFSAASSIQPVRVILGKQMHACAFKLGLMSSIFLGGALIDFYARTGVVRYAHQVFDEIPVVNTVCLNALINGYVEKKQCLEGLSLFQHIHSLNLDPDSHTISSILRICAEMSFIRLGTQCHAHFIRRIGCREQDVILLSSLVDMYGKCGSAGKAHSAFRMSEQWAGKGRRKRRDVVLWTSVLNAYGRNGLFDDVISAFEEMLVEGTDPDEIVLLVVLSACAQSGNVMKGLFYFESMIKEYGLVPSAEHYCCVVDLLCRAGELDRAWSLLLNEIGDGGTMFPVSALGAILRACSDYGNVKIGRLAFQRAVKLDQDNVGIHVELSNLYAKVGMWDELEDLRGLMLEKGIKKDIGWSRLEERN